MCSVIGVTASASRADSGARPLPAAVAQIAGVTSLAEVRDLALRVLADPTAGADQRDEPCRALLRRILTAEAGMTSVGQVQAQAAETLRAVPGAFEL